jgi:hypothetical protein
MDNPEKLAAYDAQDELFKCPQKIPNLTQGFCTHDMAHSFTPGVKCSLTKYSNGN